MVRWDRTARFFDLFYDGEGGAGAGAGTGASGSGDGDPSADALKRATYERDTAKAELAKMKRQLDEIKNQLPSEDQRKEYEELKEHAAKAEEERAKKAGEFDALREQQNKRHAKELEARETAIKAAEAKATKAEQELNHKLVELAFASATDWFGPQAKTILMPDIAQSYFGRHVVVEQDDHGARQIVVKDAHGNTLMNDKGQPMAFEKAIGELIDSHPSRDHLLRGSGKVGSNSAGGSHGADTERDLTRLKAADFNDPKVRDAVRKRQADAGGMQIGPAFDRVSR